jgi:CheY-like chemotaxis protein
MHGFWLAMTNRPDLIITDIKMPQGAGDYVVDCLRSNSDTQDIPVIVLTGQRDPQLEGKMRRMGVEEYFTKPVQFDRLRDAIGRFVRLEERDLGAVGVRAMST